MSTKWRRSSRVAELGVDAEVVLDGIRAAEPALAVLLADRVHRHEPDDVDAEVADARQVRLGGAEGALGREVALVDLVDRRAAAPLGVGQLDVGPWGVGVGGHGSSWSEGAVVEVGRLVRSYPVTRWPRGGARRAGRCGGRCGWRGR